MAAREDRPIREHEVPTHVQAEDRVLLWLTFPQVVAMVAVCALSYGTYRYAPVGPSEIRMGLAVLFGLMGIAAVVGRIGGRRLPLVAADLLKYRLGARVYAGPVSQLARSEPPAPEQPTKTSRRRRKSREKDARAGRKRAGGCPSVPTVGSASPGSRTGETPTATGLGTGAPELG